MHKLSYFHLSAAILAVSLGADARGTDLEGALQYPPPSIGEDAQPPPPARAVPQLSFIAAANRIGCQRVKPTARHAAISDPPTNVGTWSTAVDRKRTFAMAR